MQKILQNYKPILLAILGLIVLWKGIIPGFLHVNSDFPNYYVSAKLYAEGHGVGQFYDSQRFLEEANTMGIPYAKFTPFPPPTVFIMLPLSSFSPLVAKQIWTVFNVLGLVALVFLIRKITKWTLVNSALVIFLSGFGLINNFFLGQFYLILTLILFLVYYLDTQKHKIGAGALLATGVLLKYLPIIYLPIFAIKKSKTGIWTILGIFFFSVLIVYAVGGTAFSTFFDEVLFAHLNGEIQGQAKNSKAFQSFGSLFTNLVNPGLANGLTYGVVVSIGMVYLIVLFRLVKRKVHINYLFAFTGFAAMVVLPASASYHYLLMLFPLVLFMSKYKMEVPNWNPIWMLVLYSAIGWFNIGFTQFLWESTNPLAILLCYPRLWLLLFMWVYMIYLLEKVTLGNYQIKLE